MKLYNLDVNNDIVIIDFPGINDSLDNDKKYFNMIKDNIS